MFRMRNRRMRRINRPSDDNGDAASAPIHRRVPESELFARMGFKPETVH